MKLVKNEVRFSKLIRPDVGDVVEFDPVIILVKDVSIPETRTFIYDYMIRGAKCKVLENLENTVAVEFKGCKDSIFKRCSVSPEYLIKRNLTDKAVRMISELKAKLNIS